MKTNCGLTWGWPGRKKMHFKFKCPACGKQITGTHELAGAEVACPFCHHRLRVPGESAHEKRAHDCQQNSLRDVIERIRQDRGFAAKTVARNGENVKDWIPTLSRAEIRQAVQEAKLALSLIGRQLGQYKILEEVGQGGFGVVFKACDVHLDEIVAIKELRLDNPGVLKDEAKLLSKLRHENIAGFRQLFPEGEHWYLVMDFVSGGSLAHWIRTRRLYEGGPQNALAGILSVAAQFARGLSYAHQNQIIHQDVKPGNVLITPDGIAKVTDFGLARAGASLQSPFPTDSRQSVLVSIGGMTPSYCSPEQFRKYSLTRKTDSWSWGLSVLEMFTGEVLWTHGTAAGLALENFIERNETRDGIPSMPESLERLLGRCFEAEPRKRPGMEELTAILGDILQKKKARGSRGDREKRSNAWSRIISRLLKHPSKQTGPHPVVAPDLPELRSLTIAKTDQERNAVLNALSYGNRYANVGNGTVVDTRTNLMWAREPDGNTYTWKAADDHAKNRKLGGYNDWRLPSIDQLKALADTASGTLGWMDRGAQAVWSSTECVLAGSKEAHLVFESKSGPQPRDDYKWENTRVYPVREASTKLEAFVAARQNRKP